MNTSDLIKESEKIYFKIYYHKSSAQVKFVCMQWFDEHDYNQENFLSDIKFNTEQEARKYYMEHFYE